METLSDLRRSEASVAQLALDFSTRISELTAITHLRLDESSAGLVAPELANLEYTIRGIEEQLNEIKTYNHSTAEALPKLEALQKAFMSQAERLSFLASNLPSHLPGQPLPSTASQYQRGEPPIRKGSKQGNTTHEAAFGNENASDNTPASQPTAAEVGAAKRKRPPAPRRYVTWDELAAVSSYLVARTPLEKVNAAVDDAAVMAEGVAKLLAAARTGGAMAAADRQRAQMLMVNVQNKEGVKGQHWFMEEDMKRASGVLRMDKSGKTLLTLLRHLGRLQELRLHVDGSLQPVYIVH